MKFSRRELVALAAVPALEQAVPAQVPTPAALPAAPSPPVQAIDPAKAARDANRRNAETLAKFEVPMATEPCFRFQP
jgi:hypothetical protein